MTTTTTTSTTTTTACVGTLWIPGTPFRTVLSHVLSVALAQTADSYLFVSLPMANQPLVRDGASAVIFDSTNPSMWRSIQADETLFWCAVASTHVQGAMYVPALPCLNHVVELVSPVCVALVAL
jgi:hypothetical protein